MKKFNKGILALLILILGVAVYLIIQGVRGQTVKQVAAEYVKTELGAKYLSADTLAEYKNSPEKCVEKIQNGIKSYYIDDENAYKGLMTLVKSSVETAVTNQGNEGLTFKLVEKNTTEEKVITNGNKAKFEYSYFIQFSNGNSERISGHIILEYADGEWKVGYSTFGSVNIYEDIYTEIID